MMDTSWQVSLNGNCEANEPKPGEQRKKKVTSDSQELRRKRMEQGIQLRKQKRESELLRRRNLGYLYEDDLDDLTDLNHVLSSIGEVVTSFFANQFDREQQLNVTQTFRKLLVRGKDLDKTFVDPSVLPMLLKMVSCDDPRIVLEVLSLFNQVINENKENIHPLVHNGIVSILILIFTSDLSKNSNIVEQVMLMMADVSLISKSLREEICKCDILSPLIQLVQLSVLGSPQADEESVTRLTRATTWTVSCICKYNDVTTRLLVKSVVDHFHLLKKYFDDEVAFNTLTTLALATDNSPYQSENEATVSHQVMSLLIERLDVLKVVVDHLSKPNKPTLRPAIRILSNIISCGETFAQVVINCQALTKLVGLVSHAAVQSEVAFAVSNITAGSPVQIQAVIDNGLIPLLVEQLYFGDFRTQCEVVYMIFNVSMKASGEQVKYLINPDDEVVGMDVFDAMATMLTVREPDTILVTLKSYYNLLNRAKVLQIKNVVCKKCRDSVACDYIDSLQEHDNLTISSLAKCLVDAINDSADDNGYDGDSIGMHVVGYNF